MRKLIVLLMSTPLAHATDVVISGAGPGGLATAIAAKLAGARDVRVVERREGHAWATRDRSVFLSDQTVRTLGELGVDVPGTPIASWHVVRGGRQRVLPNEGHWKDEIFHRIFHRRFESIVSIGAFERRLLDRARALGMRVEFGVTLRVEDTGSAARPARAAIGDEVVTADLVVVAEGARSATRDALGISLEPAHVGTNPTYASIDFHVPASGHPGQCFFFIGDEGRLDGYGCRADGYGTFGLIDPERFTAPERATKLAEMARQIGITPAAEPRGYEGRLGLARGVRSGRVVLIGDSARVTDPSSSSGLNGAIADASLVADFVRDGARGDVDAGLRRLGGGVAEHTADVLRKALYFQDLFAWGGTRLRRVWGVAPLGRVGAPTLARRWTVHDGLYRFGLLLPRGAQGWATGLILRAARGPGDLSPGRYPNLPAQHDDACAGRLAEAGD